MKNLKLIWLVLLTSFCVGSVLAQEKSTDCAKYGTENFVGKNITLDFEETELQKILAEITKQIGCEFVIDKSIGKPVFSIQSRNVAWDETLKSLIKQENLGIQQTGPIFRIANLDALKREVDYTLTNCAKPLSSNSVRTEIIMLRDNLYPMSLGKDELGKLVSSKLSKNGSYEIDDSSKALKVIDLEENLVAVRKLITKLYINLVGKEVK